MADKKHDLDFHGDMNDVPEWLLAGGGALLAGLAGSTHCLVMCGGISAALGAHSAKRWMIWLYQAGRVLGYGLIGGLGAALVGGLIAYSGWRQAGLVLRLLLAAALLLIGLNLLTGWRFIERFTAAGNIIWRRLAPFAGRLLPPSHAGDALLLGFLWGWLPCGLVYAMLPAAWASGNALNGAAFMIAFGLGTVPAMGLTAAGFQRFGVFQSSSRGRRAAGLLLIAAALVGLYNATWRTEHHDHGQSEPNLPHQVHSRLDRHGQTAGNLLKPSRAVPSARRTAHRNRSVPAST